MTHFLQNEAVMNPVFRDRVTDSKGFCNHHMHMLYKAAYGGRGGDALGYALYMQSIAEDLLRELNDIPIVDIKATSKGVFDFGSKRKQEILNFEDKVEYIVRGRRPCPACESLLSLDRIYLETIVEMLSETKFEKEFKSFKGLCLPHFVSAVRMIGEVKVKYPAYVVNRLMEFEKARLNLLYSDLSEFIRKRKWDYRNEPAGAEVDANLIALKILAGVEGLYCRSVRNFLTKESNA